MRFARRSSLLIVLAAALLAGCGGNQIAADEVTVEPPVLTVPTDEDAAPGATDADAADAQEDDEDADADADATATPTAEPGTGGGTTGGTTTGGTTGATGTTGGSTGGTAATPAPTATAPPADTGGAQADEGLDQFCADNPGAC